LVKPGHIFTGLKKLKESWLISVDIKPYGLINGRNQNILLLKNNNNVKICKVGLKIDNTQLAIQFRLNGTNIIPIPLISPYNSLPMDQYSTLKIYQMYDEVKDAFIFEVVVNGIPIASTVNTDPKVYYNVNVFTNNEVGELSKVYIKGLYVLNIK